MKILHTADIHLKRSDDERWQALSEIIKLGNREKIDALLISGDLFDRDIDAMKIKTRVRELFSGNNYRIFIIPGNHDSKSFEEGSFLGANVEVINLNDDIYEVDDVRIAGLPYMNIRESEIYDRLNYISEKLNGDKCNILLYHGELLNAFYSRGDFGEEGDNRYMPVTLDYFYEMNFDYVLAGHFHTNFNVWEFDKKRYFVYPGSPVSITRRETGKRKVNMFEAGKAPDEILLDTQFYEEVNIKLDPFIEDDPITVINQKLDRIDSKATILLTVGGYINRTRHGIDEKTLYDKITRFENERENIIEAGFKFADLSKILEDNIFKTFMDKLNTDMITDSEKSEIRELFIRAMMEAGV